MAVLSGCGGGGSSSGGETGGGTGSESTAEIKPGGVIRLAQLTEPTTLDPIEAVEGQALFVSTQINEPLFELTEEGALKPMLAASYKQSPDELTWTINLLKGIKFSNGEPMTSKDVAFTLEASRKGAFASNWEDIESIKATSPSQIQIKTIKPLPAMIALLSCQFAAIVPANYGGVSEKEFSQHPVGTGPFEFKKWKHGTSITLTKSSSYREPNLPYVNEVVYTVTPDDSSRIAQFRAGELDLIGQPAHAQIAEIEQTPGVTVTSYGEYLYSFLSLNLKEPLFKNRKVREAINLAVDREGIVKVALDGHGTPAGAPIPPTIPGSNTSIKPPEQNVEKAKELVAEAVEEGVKPSFTMVTASGEAYAESASQILQQNLEEIGIAVKLQPLDISTEIEKMLGGEDDAVLAGYYGGIPDPSELTDFYINYIAKVNGVNVAPLEKLANEAASESDPTKRTTLYDEIQEDIINEMQVVSLDYEPAIWAVQANLAGIEVNPVNTLRLGQAGYTN